MTDTTAPVAEQGQVDRPAVARPGLTLLALGTAGLVVSLQQTLVLPLLPRLMETFDTSVSAIAWVFTATLLAGAVATPLLSRFGDMYGKKKMITLTMALLVAGSVICAVSDSLPVMIVGRALQGTAAAVIPLAIGIIRDTLPREKVTAGIGIVSATMGVGGALGMLVTGVIAENTDSHHPVFWLSAAMAVVGLVFVVVCTRESGTRTGGRPDLLGAGLLAGFLICLLLAVSQGNSWGWSDAKTLALFAGAAVLCAVWVLVEQRVREPLVQLRLLVGPKSLSANMASMLLGFAMFASFTLVSNFIQTPESQVGYGLSGSVLDVGLYMLPSTVTMLVFSALAGHFEAKLGAARTLGIGSAIAALAYIWLALQHGSGADILIFSAVQGMGIGIAYAALGTLAVQHVPMDQSGIASGINTLVRTAGGSIASAATSAILAAEVIKNTSVPSVDAYVICFVIAGVAAGLTAVIAAAHGIKHRT
ncbi:MFS transporter [Streptomyces sp. HC44]|uniref:MFS transporter n=1 Tax=Streptomyces scabichelini TaxID=2711217 RepID=A0A6G4UYY3_9ACTN|nr:MFS transporter [Streptomyces scabichelini]NGO06877.1 MFS transporter [Streptomyces scabichelini]